MTTSTSENTTPGATEKPSTLSLFFFAARTMFDCLIPMERIGRSLTKDVRNTLVDFGPAPKDELITTHVLQ